MKEGEILSILIQRKKDEFGGITAIARVLSKQLQEHNQNNLYICCMLMYYAGIRIEECRKLKVENIDFANGHITIWSSSSKTTFTDSVPLHNSLRNILASHCRGKTSSDYIFVSKNGD